MNKEAEILNTILFTITPKKMKYDIHLTKHVPDLHAENSKMLMNEVKEDLNKLRDTHIVFMDRRLNIV